MRCYVYKSVRRADTYLFLAERDGFARVPASLQATLGALVFSFAFELTPGRKLVRGDAEAVRANLVAQGFHLQVPPSAGAVASDPRSDEEAMREDIAAASTPVTAADPHDRA